MASDLGSPNPFDLDVVSTHQQARMEQTQAQVNEVVEIMKANVSKVMERDTKLDELDAQAHELSTSAQVFEVQSRKVRRKMWWRNLKFTITLGLVVLILIIIIAIWIDSKANKGNPKDERPATPSS